MSAFSQRMGRKACSVSDLSPLSNPGLHRSLCGQESACQAGDSGLIPESERSPGDGNGNPLEYSCLGNPMNREAWLQSIGSQRVGHNLETKQQQQLQPELTPFSPLCVLSQQTPDPSCRHILGRPASQPFPNAWTCPNPTETPSLGCQNGTLATQWP